ncbi:PfkB family carbohydrate kinase, partial [Schnuerera sp.]|uniref:PfkB family carbohydrate kinase n=1 Tax=Schnuerera sp. TaxID=2794844 RepID=UPI002BA1722F
SLGEEGSIVFYNGYIYRIRVPKVNVVNPVGSGDAMIGGFVSSLYRDYDFEFSLKVAAACGTANAMEAETGKVDMHNMKRIMNDIVITKSKF